MRRRADKTRMNQVAETRGGFCVSPVALPILEPPSASALPAVIPERATVLQTALSNITKLDDAIELAAKERFARRANPANRWLVNNSKKATAILWALPPLVGAGAGFMSEPGNWFFPAALGALAATVCSLAASLHLEQLKEAQVGKGEPLTQSDVASAAAMLREMPAAERAMLKAQADLSLDNLVVSARVTPAAAELLRSALDAGTEGLATELRTGKVALLIHDTQVGNVRDENLCSSLRGLLDKHPVTERRAIADMLLACCFAHEVCTLPVHARTADQLYRLLRSTQGA